MKSVKTRPHSRLSDTSLSHRIKIAIESPDTLQDYDLEEIVDMWNMKARRMAVLGSGKGVGVLQHPKNPPGRRN